jgi:hypothetical protein
VNTCAALRPPPRFALTYELKTVEAIATPIAPPICWLVLISPEASPASDGATCESAAIVTGMNPKANPSAKIK